MSLLYICSYIENCTKASKSCLSPFNTYLAQHFNKRFGLFAKILKLELSWHIIKILSETFLKRVLYKEVPKCINIFPLAIFQGFAKICLFSDLNKKMRKFQKNLFHSLKKIMTSKKQTDPCNVYGSVIFFIIKFFTCSFFIRSFLKLKFYMFNLYLYSSLFIRFNFNTFQFSYSN